MVDLLVEPVWESIITPNVYANEPRFLYFISDPIKTQK